MVRGAAGFPPRAVNLPAGRLGYRGDWGHGGRYPSYRGYYGRYPYYGRYYGRYYGGYPYYNWGWGVAGLATGLAIGATYPYDGYDPYPAYETPVAAVGGYCATAALTCALIEVAPIGTGCSCRVRGGRARGIVQ
jgi:hypothetical protein